MKRFKGIKCPGDDGTASSNLGLTFTEQKDGSFTCDQNGSVFPANFILHDLKKGYLAQINISKKAKDFVDYFFNSKGYKELRQKIDRDFLNYVVYGKSPIYVREDILEDMSNNFIDKKTIVERFKDVLTEQEIELILNKKNNE